ncbi:DNA cytosine methyltransferase [Micromonospora sp. CA-248212]|uniref:DNA cytosine methyltransferase n=1 Tax=Micromonospora sp. CA-248212 TaxID=3239961 RepID=UPI003D8CE6A0
MLTSGALCKGYGGLEMAAEMLFGPMERLWYAEFDPATTTSGKPVQQYAAQACAAHWPNVPNLGDLTAVDWATLPRVDVLIAGFPCTDVSAAGKRAGLKPGTRTGIWSHIAYGIGVLKPRLVLLENVEGLLSGRSDSDVEPCPWCLGDIPADLVVRALGAVLADLAALGFDAEWITVPASDVGAPHRRKRVFIAAWPAADAQGVGHGHTGASGIGRVPSAAVAGAAGVGANGVALLPTPRATDGTKGGPNQRGTGGSASTPGQWGPYASAIARWELVTGRQAPSPTEPGTKGQPRLSPLFVEWLMGLPAGWGTGHVPRNGALKCLGNGVVPQQAAYAFGELLRSAGLLEVAS